jgi:hypothetical protein
MNEVIDPAGRAALIVAELSTKEDIKRLLELSLGRIIERGLRQDAAWLESQNHSDFIHIRDWLADSVHRNVPWLTNLNEAHVPKKLAKCVTVSSLVVEADKQMRRLYRKEVLCVLGAEDEEPFADEGGEFLIVRMKSPAALDRESAILKHCVGHGAYDAKLIDPDYLLLSLRDRSNNPLVTVEVHKREIMQLSGTANRRPAIEHEIAAEDLLATVNISRIDGSAFFCYTGGYLNQAA